MENNRIYDVLSDLLIINLKQNLINDFDLVDVWRLCNPTYKKFSWRRTKPVTIRRLDFFLVSDKMELDISGCGFYAPVQSDHSPIFIKISPLQETARGPGYWKFNSSLVNDPTSVEKTKEIINEVAMNITNQFEDYRIGWEFLKYIRLDNSHKFTQKGKHVNVGRNE